MKKKIQVAIAVRMYTCVVAVEFLGGALVRIVREMRSAAV